MEATFAILVVAAFGLIIGSFLTVCVYRIPYGYEKGPGDFSEEPGQPETPPQPIAADEADRITIASPSRSFCPECRAQLRWWHNIPLLSWCWLGGRCSFCQARIPFRYPLIELLSALFCVLSYTRTADLQTAALLYLFCCGLIVVTFIDIDYYIIPDVISFPGMAIGFLAAACNQLWIFLYQGRPLFSAPIVPDIPQTLWGLLAGGGFLYAVSELYLLSRGKEGLGLGDVKLLAATGLFFGWQAALYTIFIGSIIGSVLGVLQLLVQGQKLSRPLPFGPYLAAATCLFLFTDPELPTQLVQRLFYLR